jgi:hypothetical protein
MQHPWWTWLPSVMVICRVRILTTDKVYEWTQPVV